jgi:hypothetical protein
VEYVSSCDGKDIESVREVFDIAQRIALFPGCKLFDMSSEDMPMRSEVVSALKHIFRRADVDGDGHLNEQELNDLQKACFTEGELQDDAMAGLKALVQHEVPNGVSSKGFNWLGFEHIWKTLKAKQRFETFWVILRHCGFDDALCLAAESIPLPPCKDTQEYVLSEPAIAFLHQLFHDEISRLGALNRCLSRDSLENLLSVAPERLLPWKEHFGDSVERALQSVTSPNNNLQLQASSSESSTTSGTTPTPTPDTIISTVEPEDGISLEGWLAFWHLFTSRNAHTVAAILPYLGYGIPPLSASGPRQTSQAQVPSPIKVVQRSFSPLFIVDVVGLPKSGRTQLMRAFLNLPFISTPLLVHQDITIAATSFTSAALAFQRKALSASSPRPLRSQPTGSSSTVSSSKSTKGKATTNVDKSKSSAAKPSTPAKPSKTITPWQARGDLTYQRNISWERGIIILNEQNLLTYMQENVNPRPSDLVLLTFDVSDEEAFDRVSAWLISFRSSYAHLLVQLVGTKSDLQDVTSHRAVQLASDLRLPAPIITSVQSSNFGDLVSVIHREMNAHRAPQWNTSAVALGRNFVGALVPHLPKVAIVVGVAAAVWVGVAHSGYLLPHLKAAWIWIKGLRWAFSPMLVRLYGTIRSAYMAEAADNMPEEVARIQHRPAPNPSPILQGSEQRLGRQR